MSTTTTVSKQNANVERSMKLSTENISSINKIISETPKAVCSAVKDSYAAVVKESVRNVNGTPKSSLNRKGATPAKTPVTSKPVLIGTSAKVIGKLLSPQNQGRQNVRPKAKDDNQKAVWVSKLHRDTTEEEVETYIKDLVGSAETDQFQVRKLVKKRSRAFVIFLHLVQNYLH